MSEQWETIKPSRYAMLIPGTDQARFRFVGAQEWSKWQHIPAENGPVSINDFVLSRSSNLKWEFRRPVRPVAKAKSKAEQISAQDWVPVIDPNHVLRAQRDQVRTKEAGQWSAWRHPPFGEGLTIAQYFTGPGEWECRTPRELVSQQPQRPAPEQPPAPTTDRGGKYHRTITQTLPGEFQHLAITVDVYDVLRAYGVRCGARQHAVKKLLCAGLRGSKDARQDLREAIEAIQRAIELCEVVE